MLKGPWEPCPYETADVQAIQALAAGNANEGQQKRALTWIIEQASFSYQPSYWPGEDGRRNTDFAEGRRYVGLQLIKLLHLNISTLRQQDDSKV